MKSIRLLSIKKPISYFFLSILLASLLFSCSELRDGDNDKDEEEEGKEEILAAFDLWSDMRTYPSKVFNASSYAPAFERSLNMSISARASQLNMDLPNTVPWVELAPKNFSGRIISLAIHPTNANIMYAGSASGGLWKTTTGGTGAPGGINWTFVPTGFPVLGVGSIAFNPANANEIYIGTGEVYTLNPGGTGPTGAGHVRTFRGSYGIGILKSSDGGVTWSKSLDFTNNSLKGVMDLKVHPTSNNIVFAATTDGVYRSTNSGATWTLVHNVPLAMSLAFKPGNPNILYVGSGNFASAGTGIYKTSNSTAASPTFTQLSSAVFPSPISGKIQLAVTPANASKIYASIGKDPNSSDAQGLFVSTDDGVTWSGAATGANNILATQGWYAHDVGVSPVNQNLILWGELNTFRSTTGAAPLTQTGTWSLWNVNNQTIGTTMEGTSNGYVHADLHKIVASPFDATGQTFFLCTDGGVFKTTDGGSTFQTMNGGLNTAQIYANMTISPVNRDYMLLGLQDNEAMVYEGTPGSRRIGSLGDGFHTAIKADGTVQLVESYYFNRRRSTNSGASFGGTSGAVAELACFNVPMVYSRAIPSAYMFGGSIYFKRSTNDGNTWTNLNGGNPIAGANNPVIAMVAPNNSTVYFSTAPASGVRSKLWKTTNATVANPTFTEITGTLPDRYYSSIDVDPTNPLRVAVTLSGFGSSHVYLSTNGGTSWCDINSGLPDVPHNVVRFDPDNPANLYVGNDLGVYYANAVPSGILGASYALTWTAYNDGFTDAMMVSDLEITPVPRKIRLGSYGRGLWERDMAPMIALPVNLISFDASRDQDANLVSWKVTGEENVLRYDIEYSADGARFIGVGNQSALNNPGQSASYSFRHAIGTQFDAFYRLKITDRDGSIKYSSIVKVGAVSSMANIYVYPNPTSGLFRIHVPVAYNTLVNYRVIDMSGKVVIAQQVSLMAGTREFAGDISSLPAGQYRIVLQGREINWKTTIIKTR